MTRQLLRRCSAGVLVAALAAGCAAAVSDSRAPALGQGPVGNTAAVPRRPAAPLTDSEMALARAAWKYFENNYQAATGFVNAADRYPSTTMWDLASSLAATVSARELGLIEQPEFDRRMRTALESLGKIALFRDQVPNKVYHAATLAQVGYTNQPGEVGFSAIDLGRMLTWLRIVRDRYPEYTALADAVPMRWNFCRVVDPWGTLFGSSVQGNQPVQYLQEGRLGYEEYAAKGFALWGFDTSRASRPEPYEYVKIYGFDIPYDRRDPRELGAHNYVVSESYVLDGLEFNWDTPDDRRSTDDVHTDAFLAAHADRIFEVQKARFRDTGILTARSEHQLEEAPFFVYDTIYTDGLTWNTITDTGMAAARYAALATKAAVGLWALWVDPYADQLFARSAMLVDPERGIFEGDYEDRRGPIRTFTANNNGIILETLLYRQIGKLLPGTERTGPWEQAVTAADRAACRPRKGAAPQR